MNRWNENLVRTDASNPETLEPGLREALRHFRSSVNAWSDAAMSRPRAATVPARTNWQLVTKWVLACAVFALTVSGGVYQNHRQLEAARAEAERIALQQRELAAQQARAEEKDDIMAKVDSDVAREVPSALEPLASLMNEDDVKGN
jgi:hypothetical protein